MKLNRVVDNIDGTGERFVFSSYESETELEHVHRYLIAAGYCKGKRVLDAACGEGFGIAMLSQVAHEVVGIDISEDVISRASKKYADVEFKVASVLNLPFENASFDVITSFETIEHVEDHLTTLMEFSRLLKPDGILIISSPDRESYNRTRIEANPFHVRELDREEFAQALKLYFPHCSWLGQRVIYSSIAVPRTAVTAEIDDFRIINGSSGEIEKIRLHDNAVYFIAICSKRESIELAPSIYEGGLPFNPFSSLIGGIEERDNIIRNQASEIATFKAKLEMASNSNDCITRIVETKSSLIVEKLTLEVQTLQENATQLGAAYEALSDLLGKFLKDRAKSNGL